MLVRDTEKKKDSKYDDTDAPGEISNMQTQQERTLEGTQRERKRPPGRNESTGVC